MIGQSAAARFAPRAAARLATITPGPLSIRKTMATPPTITTATGVTYTTSGTTGSTLTAPVNFPYNTAGRWRTLGGFDTTISTGGNYAYNGTSGPIAVANNYIGAYSKQFIHRGQALEVAWRATKAGSQGYGIRIAADGQWIGPVISPASADFLRYLTLVDFGSRAERLIEVQLGLESFGGINIAGTDSIHMAQGPATRVGVLGDSYTVAGNNAGLTYPGGVSVLQACQMLGWDDCWLAGIPGTGYNNPGSSAGVTNRYIDRIPQLMSAMAANGGLPDVVIISGGYNDSGANMTGLQQQVTDTIASAHLYAPNADIIVIGCQQPVSGTIPAQAAVVKAGALASPYTALFLEPTAIAGDLTNSWTPTGTQATLTGGDNVHRTQEGHDGDAYRMATAIREFYQSQVRSLA